MTCPLCQAKSRPITDPKTQETYHACPQCAFIYKDPKYHLSDQDDQDRYLLHDNSLENEGYRQFLQRFLDQGVSPFFNLTKLASVLDYGSGPYPAMQELLKEDYDLEADIYDLHFAPDKTGLKDSYDLVMSTEVVEHFQNPLENWQDLVSYVKEDGGLLAIMTLFAPQEPDDFLNWFYRRDPTHVSFYQPKTLDFLAESFNLDLIWHDGKRMAVFKK